LYYLSKNKQSGFTLVELLIAMTIGLIILAALSSTFLMQRKTYDVQEQIVEMVQTARAAMDMMTREIRMAGYMVVGNAITNHGNNTITFLCDIDSDIVTTVDTNSASIGDTSIFVDLNDSDDCVATTDFIYISDGINTDFIQATGFNTTGEPDIINLSAGLTNSYSVGSTVQTVEQIIYDLNGTTLRRNNQPLAENIQSVTFDYLDSNGNPTATTADIRQIKITITVRTSKADGDYSANNGYRTHTLTSLITPRNLGL
jgi:type IV pilus assembly protein PilW